MILGKIYKFKDSDDYHKLTGINFVIGLIDGEAKHFIELSFETIGRRHEYSIRRIRERSIPLDAITNSFVAGMFSLKYPEEAVSVQPEGSGD